MVGLVWVLRMRCSNSHSFFPYAQIIKKLLCKIWSLSHNLAVTVTKWKNVYGNYVLPGRRRGEGGEWLRGYYQSWVRGEVCHLSSRTEKDWRPSYLTHSLSACVYVGVSIYIEYNNNITFIPFQAIPRCWWWCEIYLNMDHGASSLSFLTNQSLFLCLLSSST